LDLDRKSWRERGVKAPAHYDAGPPVKTRFTTFAAEGFEIDACLEAEDRRLAEAEVWRRLIKPITAGLIDAPRLKLMRRLRDGAALRFRLV